MTNELPQEAIDYIDSVIQQKIDDGATPKEATQSTIAWLEGLGKYLAKHQANGLH
jgi:hypothetical protein